MGKKPYVRKTTYQHLKVSGDGVYEDWKLVERGPRWREQLEDVARQWTSEAGWHLLGLYGARGQIGNLPSPSPSAPEVASS